MPITKNSIPRIQNYPPSLIKKTSLTALDKAISFSGGWASFIRKLGIYDQLIMGWKNSHYGVNPRYVIAIERLTAGKVTRFELRMDIFQKLNLKWD